MRGNHIFRFTRRTPPLGDGYVWIPDFGGSERSPSLSLLHIFRFVSRDIRNVTANFTYHEIFSSDGYPYGVSFMYRNAEKASAGFSFGESPTLRK